MADFSVAGKVGLAELRDAAARMFAENWRL